jgi:hypothetical protein
VAFDKGHHVVFQKVQIIYAHIQVLIFSDEAGRGRTAAQKTLPSNVLIAWGRSAKPRPAELLLRLPGRQALRMADTCLNTESRSHSISAGIDHWPMPLKIFQILLN